MTNANRLFKLSAIATIIALSAIAPADAGTPVNPTPSGPIIILLPPQKPKDTGLRPKSPDRQEVYCTYTDGNAIIDFVFPEGMCELQLLDPETGETVTATIDSEAPEAIYVGYHGSAEVTVTTEYGNTYTGSW